MIVVRLVRLVRLVMYILGVRAGVCEGDNRGEFGQEGMIMDLGTR